MGPRRALDHKRQRIDSSSYMPGSLSLSCVMCVVDAWCAMDALVVVHSAYPSGAVGHEESAGGSLADKALAPGAARLNLDLQACLHVHRIPALELPVRIRTAKFSPKRVERRGTRQLTELLNMTLKWRCIVGRVGLRRTPSLTISTSGSSVGGHDFQARS